MTQARKKPEKATSPQPEETDQPTAEPAASVETETSPPPQDWRDVRSPIESEHNKTRDDREQQYVTDRTALAAAYHSDLADIQTAKQDALVAAGLNPDGSPPSDYGQTAPPTFDVGA